MKAAKYRDMSVDELEETLDTLRTELFKLRVGNTTKELTDTSKIGQARRELARVKTVLHERQSQSL